MSMRLARSIAVVGTCALWAACAKGGNKTDSAAAADSAAKAQAAAAPTSTAAPAPAQLSDANIAALLDEANMADSAWGSIAVKKGTAAPVKEFGHMMERDHHVLRKAGQDLAKKLNLTPQAPANDTLPATLQKMSDSMNAQAKGPAWDKAYIDHEVAVHQSVLSLLQAAQGAAQDTSLKALITKAIPNIQAHLTKAQDDQSKLGNATPAAGGGAADTTAKQGAKKGAKKG
jgi:putative membrane protein